MNDRNRMILLGIIWIAVCIAVIMPVLVIEAFGAGNVIMAGIGFAMAADATRRILQVDDNTESFSKRKRERRQTDELTSLLNLMDADEQDDFKQQLKDRMLNRVSRMNDFSDGELNPTSLEALLNDQRRTR